jgi:hypothetical protein
LRGHFPLEPDVIAATVAAVSGEVTDGVVIVPAFPDAGRVTIGGVHYMRGTGAVAGELIPVAETEFARDASFGFANSEMARYVEEKSGGRFPAATVIVLDLDIIRAGCRADGVPADPERSARAIADAIERGDGLHPDRGGHCDRERFARPGPGTRGSRTPRQEAPLPGRSAVRPGPHRPGNPGRAHRRSKPTPATPRPRPAA